MPNNHIALSKLFRWDMVSSWNLLKYDQKDNLLRKKVVPHAFFSELAAVDDRFVSGLQTLEADHLMPNDLPMQATDTASEQIDISEIMRLQVVSLSG